jgi:hypothetical protein
MSSRVRSWTLFFCAGVLTILATAATSHGVSLEFSQVDFNMDNLIYTDTEWGKLNFTFAGFDGFKYLNLAVNGSWQIQNIPVVTYDGVGVDQSIGYFFNLGCARGTDLTSLQYDYALTDAVLGTMPGGSTPSPVASSNVNLWPGESFTEDVPGTPAALATAEPLIGGPVAAGATAVAHEKFPNQSAKNNGCVPTAISNSVKYLKDVKKLSIPDSETSIETMEKELGWSADKGCDPDAWPAKKKTWGEKYGITTRIIAAPTTEAELKTLFDNIVKEMKDKQDVELRYKYEDVDGGGKKVTKMHIAPLVSITPQADGTYSIQFGDDLEQGDGEKGEVTAGTFDPKTGKLKRPNCVVQDKTLFSVIIECPEPSTFALLIPVLALVVWPVIRPKARLRR